MSELPSVPLGEIATPILRPVAVTPGTSYRTLGVKWWGEGAYERDTIDGSQTAAKTLFEVQQDDLIINKIWVRHGSVAIAGAGVAGCAGSNEFPTFALNRQRVLPRWIHWYSKTRELWQKCDALSQGTSGKNRIRPERFLTVTIPLPTLPEQRRIVAKIEELAAKIEEATELWQNLHEMAFTLPVAASNSIFDSSTSPIEPLSSVLAEDSRNGIGTKPSDSPPGVPILRISAGTSRTDGIVDESDHKFIEISDRDRDRYSLRFGDLLACRFNGNLHYVGRFSLYTRYSGQAQVYPDKLIRFRVTTSQVIPAFVRYAMNSVKCRRFIEAHCATTAGNIGISASNLKTTLLPVPSLEHQRQIVAYLDRFEAEVDRLKAIHKKTRTELVFLLPSILKDAFSGKL